MSYETLNERGILRFTHDSWIKEVQWRIDTHQMIVYTDKQSYGCKDVPLETFEEFAITPRKGRYFNKYIKDKYLDDLFK